MAKNLAVGSRSAESSLEAITLACVYILNCDYVFNQSSRLVFDVFFRGFLVAATPRFADDCRSTKSREPTSRETHEDECTAGIRAVLLLHGLGLVLEVHEARLELVPDREIVHVVDSHEHIENEDENL